MKLVNATIHKYKSFESDQSFKVEDDITILVGMNESGKTSILESIAKTNYFQDDDHFEFSLTHDYPRREKKAIDKAEKTPLAITCEYAFTDEVKSEIE
ncbi:AAA family ATPase, partial [Chitinophaga sp.]|uniref:AAA family ATPase n=1 Tax=Chitinophaga sp. TaxID=1869181 RepID=UPI002F9406FB